MIVLETQSEIEWIDTSGTPKIADSCAHICLRRLGKPPSSLQFNFLEFFLCVVDGVSEEHVVFCSVDRRLRCSSYGVFVSLGCGDNDGYVKRIEFCYVVT